MPGSIRVRKAALVSTLVSTLVSMTLASAAVSAADANGPMSSNPPSNPPTNPPSNPPTNPPSNPPTSAASSGAAGSAAAATGEINVTTLFANTCGWCHSGAGRIAGKGPQLMGTTLTDTEIVYRIKNGKTGAMPGFGATFTEDQLKAIVKYIRDLKPEA